MNLYYKIPQGISQKGNNTAAASDYVNLMSLTKRQ
jgi:hypothetical protein